MRVFWRRTQEGGNGSAFRFKQNDQREQLLSKDLKEVKEQVVAGAFQVVEMAKRRLECLEARETAVCGVEQTGKS